LKAWLGSDYSDTGTALLPNNAVQRSQPAKNALHDFLGTNKDKSVISNRSREQYTLHADPPPKGDAPRTGNSRTINLAKCDSIAMAHQSLSKNLPEETR